MNFLVTRSLYSYNKCNAIMRYLVILFANIKFRKLRSLRVTDCNPWVSRCCPVLGVGFSLSDVSGKAELCFHDLTNPPPFRSWNTVRNTGLLFSLVMDSAHAPNCVSFMLLMTSDLWPPS